MHAYQHSHEPEARTIDCDLVALLETAPELARKLVHLTSIPGVGLTTAIVVVAKTSGLTLVENEH